MRPELKTAVKNGDVKKIAALLTASTADLNEDIEVRSGFEWSICNYKRLINIAIKNAQPDVLSTLLKFKAEATFKGKGPYLQPLKQLARDESLNKRPDTRCKYARLLIEAGADPVDFHTDTETVFDFVIAGNDKELFKLLFKPFQQKPQVKDEKNKIILNEWIDEVLREWLGDDFLPPKKNTLEQDKGKRSHSEEFPEVDEEPPLKKAATEGKVEELKKLLEQPVDNNDDITGARKAAEEKLAELQQEQKKLNRIVRLLRQKEKRKPLTIHQQHFYGYASLDRAMKQEFRWQQVVHERFFRVGKPIKKEGQADQLFREMDSYVQKKLYPKCFLPIDNYSSRTVIIALSKIISKFACFPSLILKIGDTCLECVSSESKKQVGNVLLKILDIKRFSEPAYGEKLAGYLSNIPKANNKILAPIMLEKSKKMAGFSYEDCRKFMLDLPYRQDPSNFFIKDFIHFLNGLVFLTFIVEPVRRLYRDNEGKVFDYPHYQHQLAQKSDKLPMAFAQGRAIVLVGQGKLFLRDIYGASECYDKDSDIHRAQYGVATGQSTIDFFKITETKFVHLNALFDTWQTKEIISQSGAQAFNRQDSNGIIIPGCNKLKEELRDYYGGADESDDENYSDDEDNLDTTAASATNSSPKPKL